MLFIDDALMPVSFSRSNILEHDFFLGTVVMVFEVCDIVVW